MKRAAILGAAILVSMVGLAVPQQAQAGHAVWYQIASWEMNERTNATVLRDSTNDFDGHIGKRVTPTDRRYHQFKTEERGKVFPQHVDRVPDNDFLDPSFSDFMVQIRFKWSSDRHDMNFVQKGQGSPAGGMFKVKTSVPGQPGQPLGGVKCLFRGSNGDSQVQSWGERAGGINPGRLNDGQWHVLECSRDVNGALMFIDNVFVDMNENQPGEISNDWPIAIGGNTYCADTPTENNVCNYFDGKIDYVRFYDS